jgi:pyruvate dehydrogenase E2 component (dihydrolipoamide acetyltransferase)
MAIVEMTMPKFGLTMQEGSIVRWLKRDGEAVQAGEPVVEIETEKITCEVEAPVNGVINKVLQPEGSVVPVGAPLALIEPA